MGDNAVLSTETVARILSPEWIEEGELMHVAFMLNEGETYISVNRPSVESYDRDIAEFIEKHTDYSFGGQRYKRALLNVGDIRSIDVSLGDITAAIDVDVEARDKHTKSHAGIFTRFQDKNIKRGQTLKVTPLNNGISADDILLEVRMSLLDISILEDCHLCPR